MSCCVYVARLTDCEISQIIWRLKYVLVFLFHFNLQMYLEWNLNWCRSRWRDKKSAIFPFYWFQTFAATTEMVAKIITFVQLISLIAQLVFLKWFSVHSPHSPQYQSSNGDSMHSTETYVVYLLLWSFHPEIFRCLKHLISPTVQLHSQTHCNPLQSTWTAHTSTPAATIIIM